MQYIWQKTLDNWDLGISNISVGQTRGGSRAAATSKMELFVIIVNSFQSLTIITKHSILDVAAALYPSLSHKISGPLDDCLSLSQTFVITF